jgi:hypothetical protein
MKSGSQEVQTARRNAPARWGSDPIADLLQAPGLPFVALAPGASCRGLHDSLVNHVGGSPALLHELPHAQR